MSLKPNYVLMIQELTRLYGKNYAYPKHHALVHLPFDLKMKGSTDNYTTRPGEGFQQEVQQAYDQTNFRDTEKQVRNYFTVYFPQMNLSNMLDDPDR